MENRDNFKQNPILVDNLLDPEKLKNRKSEPEKRVKLNEDGLLERKEKNIKTDDGRSLLI